MARATKSQKLTIHVVLDTNCLFTDAAHVLLNQETTELIKAANVNTDIVTVWHLPAVVRGERKYQMMLRASRLLPNLEKLEDLLGHKLAITKETLNERVEAAIQGHMTSLGLKDLPLDTSKVNWIDLIEKAINRLPPFSEGEKEKGFRDAVILESFCQLMEDKPVTPAICRIFLITNDGQLRVAAQERIGNRANARAVATLEELRTVINALKSEMGEALINTLLPKAQTLFWNAEDKTCLWYRSISAALFEENKAIVEGPPPEGGVISRSAIVLIPPVFIKKVGQKISFETKVEISVEAKSISFAGMSTSGGILSSLFQPPLLSGSSDAPLAPHGGMLRSIEPTRTVEKIQNGLHIFAAKWHATLTTAGKLTNAQLDSFEHLETIWEN